MLSFWLPLPNTGQVLIGNAGGLMDVNGNYTQNGASSHTTVNGTANLVRGP